jgi:signal transduction histidine kinase
MEHIRLLAHALRPPVLDTLGLNLALEGLCNDFAQRTRLDVQYRGTELPDLPDPMTICFYRFLQEALTNIAKHANARYVFVALSYTQSTRQVCLTVADDGNGMIIPQSSAEWRTGLGLAGMQERFELLGGEVMIESQPGQGTRLIACTTI